MAPVTNILVGDWNVAVNWRILREALYHIVESKHGRIAFVDVSVRRNDLTPNVIQRALHGTSCVPHVASAVR